MSTTILLVRHGETDWNRDRRIQGHSDVPLNVTGRRQARELAEQLTDTRLDAVYASDLARARETAEIAAASTGLLVTELAALREKHFGSWEGLTDATVRRRFPDAVASSWGDGETADQMSARVVDALRLIAAAHPSTTVLVVTHGGPVRATLRVCGVDPVGPIGNCHVARIVIEDGVLGPPD